MSSCGWKGCVIWRNIVFSQTLTQLNVYHVMFDEMAKFHDHFQHSCLKFSEQVRLQIIKGHF